MELKLGISLISVRTIAALVMVAACGVARAESCNIGAYKLADGQIIDIGSGEGESLRWRTLEGKSGSLVRRGGAWVSHIGWASRPDGMTVSFGACSAGAITFGGRKGRRLSLKVTETTFESDGVRLVGRLVMPEGDEPAPVVVLVHGAEHDSALDNNYLQRILPAQGVGAFVYDKRGTGASGGSYTQDFERLARDVVAAMHEARRLAGVRVTRIGYQGGSQGGWVAPLAAKLEPVDFVIVSFGLAVNVLEEDQEAIALEMRLKGHSPEEIAKGQAIGAAAGVVWESNFTKGIDTLVALEDEYRSAPWFKDLHGNFTWAFLGKTAAQVRKMAADFTWGTSFHYDGLSTLASLRTPELWVLGGQDLDAPSAETSRRIGALIAAGHPITLAIYPKAEHGMTEFDVGPGGERIPTRYGQDYFRMLADFARHGRLTRHYGDEVTRYPALTDTSRAKRRPIARTQPRRDVPSREERGLLSR
jgi:dienelactone hydrolase